MPVNNELIAYAAMQGKPWAECELEFAVERWKQGEGASHDTSIPMYERAEREYAPKYVALSVVMRMDKCTKDKWLKAVGVTQRELGFAHMGRHLGCTEIPDPSIDLTTLKPCCPWTDNCLTAWPHPVWQCAI